MYQDFKDLLSAFNARSVRYLIVGGYAVSFHGQPRATKDIDIFIKADSATAKAVFAALASFGAPLAGITPDDLSNLRRVRHSARHRWSRFRRGLGETSGERH